MVVCLRSSNSGLGMFSLRLVKPSHIEKGFEICRVASQCILIHLNGLVEKIQALVKHGEAKVSIRRVALNLRSSEIILPRLFEVPLQLCNDAQVDVRFLIAWIEL